MSEQERLRVCLSNGFRGVAPEWLVEDVSEFVRQVTADRDAEIARLRAALNELAAWHDGPVVTGKFDHPWPAQFARDALAAHDAAVEALIVGPSPCPTRITLTAVDVVGLGGFTGILGGNPRIGDSGDEDDSEDTPLYVSSEE